jgi:hypothetical protein
LRFVAEVLSIWIEAMENGITLLGTLLAAFMGAIIGPFIIYLYRKKYEAFYTVIRTFAYFYNDAIANNDSDNAPTADDLSENTTGLINKSNDLLITHFTKKAFKLFDAAIKENVSRKNAPNIEFFKKKEESIKRIKRELYLHWLPNFLIALLFLVVIFYFGNLIFKYI